ncbi:MAG TPA: hypothetical protein VGG33_20825 [Polyangia bacterium]
MKPDQLVPTLEELATKVGVTVRYEALAASGVGGTGGLCKVRGAWWLLIDKKTTPSERVAILVDALTSFDTTGAGASDKIEELISLRRIAKGQTAAASGPS